MRNAILTRRFVASMVILLFVGPQLGAILFGVEDFPLSDVPMFADYHASEDPRFRFVLLAGDRDGWAAQVVASDLRLGEQDFIRRFFYSCYGSTNPKPPETRRWLPDSDDPDRFATRMTRCFATLVGELERSRRRQIEHVDLYVLEVVGTTTVETRHIGRYDAEQRRFVHTWRATR